MPEKIVLSYKEARTLVFPHLDIDSSNPSNEFNPHNSNDKYQCVSLYWVGVQNETHQYGIVVIRRMSDNKNFATRITRLRDTHNISADNIEDVFGIIGNQEADINIVYAEVERIPHRFAKNHNPLFKVI